MMKQHCIDCGKLASNYMKVNLKPAGNTEKWWFCTEHMIAFYKAAEANGVPCLKITFDEVK